MQIQEGGGTHNAQTGFFFTKTYLGPRIKDRSLEYVIVFWPLKDCAFYRATAAHRLANKPHKVR